MKNKVRNSVSAFFLLFGILTISSCLKEEIIGISPDITESKVIAFATNASWPESGIATRSGDSSCEKISARCLVSETDTCVSLPLGVYRRKGIHALYVSVYCLIIASTSASVSRNASNSTGLISSS